MPRRLRLTGDQVVQVRRLEHEAPGGWLQTQERERPNERDRKGLHLVQQLTQTPSMYANGAAYYGESSRVLSPLQLWKLYLTTPDIRSCVDSIVRRIATWVWLAEPTVDPKSPDAEEAIELAAQVARFMNAPTQDPLISVWQEWATAFGTDLLVFDAGASELVRSPDQILREMVPLRGADFFPTMSATGQVENWRQFIFEAYGAGIATRLVASKDAPTFLPDELFYLRLFSNTTTPLGLPLIDTIVNEAVSLIVSSDHARLALDADEIPPGMVVLGGLAKEAAARAKADLRHMRGKDHKIRVITSSVAGGVDAKWIEFRRSLKDVGMIDVVREIRSTVWRVFGVMPIEMGKPDSMSRATAGVQLDVGSSHLIHPILALLQAKLTARVVPLIVFDPDMSEEENARRAGLVRFRFDLDAALSSEDADYVSQSDERYLKQGVLTRNEVRAKQGYAPKDGGDVLTVEEGGKLLPVAFLQARLDAGPTAAPPTGGAPPPKKDPPIDPTDDDEGGEHADQEPGPGEVDAEEAIVIPLPTPHVHRDAVSDLADAIDGVPAEWATSSNQQTIDLRRISEIVSNYTRAIESAWSAMEDDVLAVVSSTYTADGFDAATAARATEQVNRSIDAFADRWELLGGPYYQQAAHVGHDAATRLAGPGVAADWQAMGDAYAARAMGYLRGEDGPIAELKMRVSAILGAATTTGPSERIRPYVPPELQFAEAPEVLMEVQKAIGGVAYRVANFTEKPIELANDVLYEGLVEATAQGDGTDAEIWYGMWLCNMDKASCSDCRHWGRLGFLPLNNFTTRPAGAVKCGARCRCMFLCSRKSDLS